MYFDRDGNGFIDCTEFLVGLRGDLPPSRKKFIRMAFDILDTDKSGKTATGCLCRYMCVMFVSLYLYCMVNYAIVTAICTAGG